MVGSVLMVGTVLIVTGTVLMVGDVLIVTGTVGRVVRPVAGRAQSRLIVRASSVG